MLYFLLCYIYLTACYFAEDLVQIIWIVLNHIYTIGYIDPPQEMSSQLQYNI